ncbi:hypothetical protein MIN45_P2195 [Methylomarinovum tepidoasis]|uniref:Aminotransferase n=1 Tax=Methylomarinovum tepidoasis TaxID=2840183 RepID=A0AAU9CCU9_9GAMM|nr:pyridoxal phosphate-dependent aminotransferase [Methylomarinovum sp. IN45]BCX89822.1 hypothetical protein MIN45_P2195 [Methylomarinovum sp. IN45]
MPRQARRAGRISPFHVMELLARARELEAQGRDIVHLEIGEPDFPTPAPIVAAGRAALAGGNVRYTTAAGLMPLREALAAYYHERYGVAVSPGRIFLTPGASGACLLALGLALDVGDEVLVSDPGYPCNRHFVQMVGGRPRPLAVEEDSDFHLDAAQVEAAWSPTTRGVWITSPSNPTGSVIPAGRLAALWEIVEARGGFLLADEIYHGLEYGCRCTSALEISDRVLVVNSFSKYFGMTGWRLGWLIVPPGWEAAAERLAQNLFIAAPTHSQRAALAAFTPETRAELERRRQIFAARGRYLYQALTGLGLRIASSPQGAFYLYADCSAFTDDSETFASALLEKAGVAVTPGCDFGRHRAGRYLRFAYTVDESRLAEGVRRLAAFLEDVSK